MSKKRSPKADSLPELREEVAQEPVKPVMTLKLRQNAFVRGAFARGGSLHQFQMEEAERRLRTTQLWDKA